MFDDDSLEGLLSRIGRQKTDPILDEPECAEAISFVANPTNLLVYHSRQPADRELPEVRLGQYALLDKIGEGGMGSVFRARHLHLQKIVAVKILSRHRGGNLQSHSQFQHEIISAGQINHPNIITATDAGEDRGIQFLVMEFVDGFDLGRLISRCGPMEVPAACEVVKQVASALGYLSNKEMVHGDIKPSNIMLTLDGRVKLLDLGLTRGSWLDSVAEDDDSTRMIAGTLAFMAPEYAEPHYVPRVTADLFSLGATLIMLVTGQPLRSTRHLATESIRGLLGEPVTIPAAVPAVLLPVLTKLIHPNPAERFQRADQLIAELNSLSTDADLARLSADVAMQLLQETAPLMSSGLPTILVQSAEPQPLVQPTALPVTPPRRPVGLYVGVASVVVALCVLLYVTRDPAILDSAAVPKPDVAAAPLATVHESAPSRSTDVTSAVSPKFDPASLRDDRATLQMFLQMGNAKQPFPMRICRLSDSETFEVKSASEFPDEPFSLLVLGATTTEGVVLNDNQLEQLAQFESLTLLYLKLARPTELQMQYIGRIPRLQRLSLVAETLPASRAAWDHFAQRLYFYDLVIDAQGEQPLQVNDALLTQIARCRFLRSVILIGNQKFEISGSNPLAGLVDLFDLNLAGANLNSKFLSSLPQLGRVRTLSLYSSDLDSQSLELLHSNDRIVSLALGNSPLITDADLQQLLLGRLQLQQLNLQNLASVHGGFLASLHQHPALARLSYRSCPLESSYFGEFARLPHLSRLDVIGSGVTRDTLDEFRQLHNLKSLNLSENPISPQDIQSLRAALPSTTIYGSRLQNP